MLPNLNDLVTPIVDKIKKFDVLDCTLPKDFKENVTNIKNGTVEYGRYSSCVTNRAGQKIYFSNNWFYIAALLAPLYEPFTEYKRILLSLVDSKDLHDSNTANITAAINTSALSPQEKLFMIKFATDPLWWNGGNSNTGGKTLERNDALVSSVLSIANLVNASQSYVADLWKFFGENPQYSVLLTNSFDDMIASARLLKFDSKKKQQIYFGAPGTGKSHILDKETAGLDVIRTTFHPDSDYSTFVGVYKPIEEVVTKTQIVWDFASKSAFEIPVLDRSGNEAKEKRISYTFVKQAFLKAYIAAWEKYGVIKPSAGTLGTKAPASSSSTPYSSSGFGPLAPSFEYEIKGTAGLSPSDEGLLRKVDAFMFSFPEISCLKELHDQTNRIKVVIQDQPDNNREPQTIVLENDRINPNIGPWLPSNDGIHSSRTFIPKVLGEYKSDIKTVFLYTDEIRTENDPTKALIDTYIHEMFHALFDCGKYIPEIDEAIVECCTLCVLELLDADSAFSGILSYSLQKKELKKQGLPHYGYGVYLYQHRSLDWIYLFKNGNASINPSDPRVLKYIKLFHIDWEDHDHNQIKAWTYPYNQEYDGLELLYEILTHAHVKAYSQQDEILIIEEINRGNCAQIFGDIFQLLDRNDFGFSKYPICPDEDIRRCLKEEFDNAGVAIPSAIDAMYADPVADKIKSGELLVLPSNLYIFATMNTSDQSLFPMDSAFKRRWNWRYFAIKNEGKEYKVVLKDGTKYDWWKAISTINSKILATTKSSDKQLGYWFAKLPEGEKEISSDVFVSKVIFYLWNDVFKDYSFGDNNPFTSETAFEKFYDKDGKVIDDTITNFMKKNEIDPE